MDYCSRHDIACGFKYYNAERVTFDFYIKNNTKVEWENGMPEVFNCYFVSFDDKGNVKDIVFVWGFDADKLGA